MKYLLLLLSIVFSIHCFSQPKIKEKYSKKDKSYEIDMLTHITLGGSIRDNDYVNTAYFTFSYYYRQNSNYILLSLSRTGYDSYFAENNEYEKNFDLTFKSGENYYQFNVDLGRVMVWTTNGVISEKPDRILDIGIYQLSIQDLSNIVEDQDDVKIEQIGHEVQTDFYFTEDNLYNIRYFLNYIKNKDFSVPPIKK
jgi:hypothetical protein